MKNDRKFLRCEICGNTVGMIEDSGANIVCCGQDMTLLSPNTVDAAQEKHIPVAKWEDGKLVVTVGSTAHPMTEEHHIAWIAIAHGKLTQRASLDHTGAPSVTFLMDKSPVTIYAYCNLHGLWMAEA